MPSVTVYSRENCPLCEEAIGAIREVTDDVAADVTVEVVDVDEDPALREEYGDRVPYVLVDDTLAFKYRVDRERLRTALE